MGQLFLIGFQNIKFEDRTMQSSEDVGGIKNSDRQDESNSPLNFFQNWGQM